MTTMIMCRVCLASDRADYRVANTSLEQIYHQLTSDTLQRGEWPATLCGVCVAMLRRCRRFAETAREANAALDHWYRGKADAKLTPTPILTLVRSDTMLTSYELLPVDKCIKVEVDPLTSEKMYDEVPVYYEQSHEAAVADDEKDKKTGENFEIVLESQRQPGPCGEAKYTDSTLRKSPKMASRQGIKTNKYIKGGPAAPQTTRSLPNADAETKTLQFSNTDYIVEVPICQNVLLKDSKEELFKCDKCKFRCKRERVLMAHKLKHNGYICDTCGKNLKLRASLIKHIISCHTDDTQYRPLACSKCDYTTKHKNLLRLHEFVRHSGEKPFSCNVCSFRCNSKQNLKRHAYIHSDYRPYFCEICGFRSIQLACLKKHMRKHKEKRKNFTDEAGVKSYVCHICDKGNDSKEALQAHLLLHTGDKPHICDYCDNRFATKKALKLHSFIHTGKKLYICDTCGQNFGKKDALKTHKLLHTGEKPYVCNICNAKFARKEGLTTHLYKHTDEKPYECNICNAKFSRKGGLKTHLLKHTDEKPYVCDKCDYRASQKTALKTHLLNHTGVKLYACDKCDHRCNSKSNLNRHLMKHTGIKHLMCDKCNYRTGNRDSFKYHLATHTAEKRYGCEKCDYRCMDKRSLMSHLRKHTS